MMKELNWRLRPEIASKLEPSDQQLNAMSDEHIQILDKMFEE